MAALPASLKGVAMNGRTFPHLSAIAAVSMIASPAAAQTAPTDIAAELKALREEVAALHAAGEAVWLKSSQINDRKRTYDGGYGEIGIFLTPDTRGYHNGQFDRTVPVHPVGAGGIGAVEWNVRYDYLDLTDPSSIFAGKEWSVGSSLVWTPTPYVRFLANYIHLRYIYRGFPADTNVDTGTVRAQVDF